MSISSDVSECPKCGGELHISYDTKTGYSDGYCVDCGSGFETIETQMTLEAVNGLREDLELPSLKELKEQRD